MSFNGTSLAVGLFQWDLSSHSNPGRYRLKCHYCQFMSVFRNILPSYHGPFTLTSVIFCFCTNAQENIFHSFSLHSTVHTVHNRSCGANDVNEITKKKKLVGWHYVCYTQLLFFLRENTKVWLINKHYKVIPFAYLPECQLTECKKTQTETIQILHLTFTVKETNTIKQRNALCIFASITF